MLQQATQDSFVTTGHDQRFQVLRALLATSVVVEKQTTDDANQAQPGGDVEGGLAGGILRIRIDGVVAEQESNDGILVVPNGPMQHGGSALAIISIVVDDRSHGPAVIAEHQRGQDFQIAAGHGDSERVDAPTAEANASSFILGRGGW